MTQPSAARTASPVIATAAGAPPGLSLGVEEATGAAAAPSADVVPDDDRAGHPLVEGAAEGIDPRLVELTVTLPRGWMSWSRSPPGGVRTREQVGHLPDAFENVTVDPV